MSSKVTSFLQASWLQSSFFSKLVTRPACLILLYFDHADMRSRVYIMKIFIIQFSLVANHFPSWFQIFSMPFLKCSQPNRSNILWDVTPCSCLMFTSAMEEYTGSIFRVKE
jgi:hypothetical protein